MDKPTPEQAPVLTIYLDITADGTQGQVTSLVSITINSGFQVSLVQIVVLNGQVSGYGPGLKQIAVHKVIQVNVNAAAGRGGL